MFEWIIAARRPLSEGELCEGMAFTIEDRHWNPKKIPPNLSRIIRAGGNLVVFDKATEKIRLAHYTVRQYLLRERPISNYQFSIEKADKHLAEVCMAYLAFEDFERQVVQYVDNGVNARMKPLEMIASPTSPSRSPMDPLVLLHRLRNSRDLSSLQINHSRHILVNTTPVQTSFERFSLLEYAKAYWLWHSTGFKKSSLTTKRDILFQQLLTEKKLPFNFKPWPDNFLGRPYPDLVGWAMVNNHVPLIQTLMDYDNQFNFRDCIEESARWFFKDPSQLCVSTEMLETISSCSFDIWNPKISTKAWMYCKFLTAAQRGNVAILKLCQPSLGPDLFPWDLLRSHLIIEAAGANQHEVIDNYNRIAMPKYIHSARNFRTTHDGQFCNTLERAALFGHVEMVQKLGEGGWTASNIFDVKPAPGVLSLNNAIIGNNTKAVEALVVALLFTNLKSEPEIMTDGFCVAVSSGHLEVVDIFLAYGVDPTNPKSSGMCPYMQAIEDGNFEIFSRLFPLPGCGIEGNFTGLPLTMAAANGRIEIAEFLISKGACFNGKMESPLPSLFKNNHYPTPLYAASARGEHAAVKLLLSTGAGVDVQSCKHWALLLEEITGQTEGANAYTFFYSLEPPTTQRFNVFDNWQEPLLGAAWNGHFPVVELLLEAGASVNPQSPGGGHPLLLAAMGGHAQIVELLRLKGAKILPDSPNAGQAILACSRGHGKDNSLRLLIECGVSVQSVNQQGQSGIHLAAEAGLPEVLKQLIDFGGDVNAKDGDSMTPMMKACISQQLKSVEILIDAGADLMITHQLGFSPVSYASIGGSSYILKLLLDCEAPVDPIGPCGKTPLIEACLAGNSQIVQILLQNEANVRAKTTAIITDDRYNTIPRGSTPLMIATIMNDTNTITALLNYDMGCLEQVDSERYCSSVLLAAEFGNPEAFFHLVDFGANLRLRARMSASWDPEGILFCAVIGGNLRIIKHLIELHEKELKLKKPGLFSGNDFQRAMEANGGSSLPADIVSKLNILRRLDEKATKRVKYDTSVPIDDSQDTLFS